MKKNLPSILILAASVILFIVVTMMTPEPVDWSASFSRRDTIPFGGSILYRLLPDCFPGSGISVIHDSIYDTLRGRRFHRTGYLLIDTTLALDKYDTAELLRFVEEGNSVFMAASFYRGEFAGVMELKTAPEDVVADRMGVTFTNPRLAPRDFYVCRRGVGNTRFVSFRKKGAVVLGLNERKGANYIRISHGRGAFYLSTLPYAFTNFNMLTGENAEYVFRALSYLTARRMLWDEHYKSSLAAPSTPLRYVLSREPLTWAYYTGMAGLVLFILFKARRRQRAIPVIPLPANATLDFVTTVGRLYHQRGDHKNIAEKMVLFFYEYLNARFQIDAFHRGALFTGLVAERTGVPRGRVDALFGMIDSFSARDRITDEELSAISGLIDDFKKHEASVR